nr:MAG TPA: hypothetical protein [Caudoviricetes sp.]
MNVLLFMQAASSWPRKKRKRGIRNNGNDTKLHQPS